VQRALRQDPSIRLWRNPEPSWNLAVPKLLSRMKLLAAVKSF